MDGQGKKEDVHTFQIIAPSLRYKFDLFSAAHRTDLVYPVRVMFEPWQQADRPSAFDVSIESLTAGDGEARVAETKADLVRLVGEALTSGYTQSVIDSLIAKSNEASEPSPQVETIERPRRRRKPA